MSVSTELPSGIPAHAFFDPAHTSYAPTGELGKALRRGVITVLTGGGPLPWIMINAIEAEFGPVVVIEEAKEATKTMLKRRWRKLGPWQTIGQTAFGLYLRLLHKRADGRKRDLIARHGLDPAPRPDQERISVASVNSRECRHALAALQPEVVIVIGTRMIRRETLRAVAAPFINYHAGLNPKYRGMNGGYWALATGDRENAGVTVHLIDEGVDTGAALYWAPFVSTRDDSFVTYPLCQTVPGRALLNRAVSDALEGKLQPREIPLPSKQWYHPTLWSYLWTGLTKGVW